MAWRDPFSNALRAVACRRLERWVVWLLSWRYVARLVPLSIITCGTHLLVNLFRQVLSPLWSRSFHQHSWVPYGVVLSQSSSFVLLSRARRGLAINDIHPGTPHHQLLSRWRSRLLVFSFLISRFSLRPKGTTSC